MDHLYIKVLDHLFTDHHGILRCKYCRMEINPSKEEHLFTCLLEKDKVTLAELYARNLKLKE